MNTPPPRQLEPVTDPVDVALGAAIRTEMEERNVSVNALHIATNLSRQTISRSLDGLRTLDWKQFDKIASALGGSHVAIVRRAARGR